MKPDTSKEMEAMVKRIDKLEKEIYILKEFIGLNEDKTNERNYIGFKS